MSNSNFVKIKISPPTPHRRNFGIYHSPFNHRIFLRKERPKFTVKEPDSETGLYYYGSRYLEPKTSRWISADPALGEYLPVAGQDNSNLPGLGGIFNTVNLHTYHYAGNNPVKYTDPDGRAPEPSSFGQHNQKFANVMNSLVGTLYELGGSSINGTDCSGSILLALDVMGYELPDFSTAEMASGKLDWITINSSIDNKKTGNVGMLNFYNLDGDYIDHVNVGVGDTGTPSPLLNPRPQVVDATEGSTLNHRKGREGQYFIPGTKQVNQTYAPFSSERTPKVQAIINWAVLENKYKKEEE